MAGEEVVIQKTLEQSEAVPQWVARNTIAFIEQHNATALVVIIVLVVAACYGIFITVKNMLGYRLSNEDLKTKRLDNLTKFHDAMDKHDETSRKHNDNLAELFDAMTEGAEKDILNELREKTISFYSQIYLQSLDKYLNVYQIYHKKKKQREFVVNVVQKEMVTAKEFSDTVNMTPLLELLGRAPLTLDQSSFSRVWCFWRESLLVYPFSWKLRKDLDITKNSWPKPKSK